MKNKKAQIQMMETMGVLFVFIIIIMFGYFFYAAVSQTAAKQERAEQKELQAVKIAQIVSFLPEVQCSSENIEIEPCVDLLKVDKLTELTKNNIANKNKYLELFGTSEIYLDIIFPDGRLTKKGQQYTHEECAAVILPLTCILDGTTPNKEFNSYIFYDNSPTDTTKFSKTQTYIPTAVYDVKEKQVYFGTIVVDYYTKGS
jgi:hypothetical protein